MLSFPTMALDYSSAWDVLVTHVPERVISKQQDSYYITNKRST